MFSMLLSTYQPIINSDWSYQLRPIFLMDFFPFTRRHRLLIAANIGS
jgi:hypothetical protein